MANEINITLNISASKNGAKYQRSETFISDMAGDSWISGVQIVGAANEAIVTHSDIANYGWIFLKNCGTDSALYVDFAHDSAADSDDFICRLYGGESSLLKSAGETALYAISSSGTQNIEYAIFEL